MSGKKEAYEEVMDRLATEGELTAAEADAVYAFVGEQDARIAELEQQLTAAHDKNAKLMGGSANRVRELERDLSISREVHQETIKLWHEQVDAIRTKLQAGDPGGHIRSELGRELEQARAERDEWETRWRNEWNHRTEDVKAYTAIRSRIESAMKIWVAWHPNYGLSLTDTKPDATATGEEGSIWAEEGWLYREAHVVPVESEEGHIVDANKKVEELETEVERMNVHNEAWSERYKELERERDEWRGLALNRGVEMLGFANKLNDIRSRIESAPRVWVAWHPEHGFCLDDTVPDAESAKRAMAGSSKWVKHGWGYKEVHAVPVEDE